ncbi:MAG: MCE family protein [Haloechinothrix sp.]
MTRSSTPASGTGRFLIAVACALVAAVLAGCASFSGFYNVPLPGGAGLGEHPYRVTVHFTNVLDLVPQSAVRVNDVPVGRVDRIELAQDGRTAMVTVLVNGSVRLPANAVARLRQSSVLGEKFVELADPPDGAAHGKLTGGAVIPVERTNRNTEMEEVLGALSLVLNGGGIGQLKEINSELNAALAGNTGDIKSFLHNLETFIASFDGNRDEITRAIDETDKLATTLAGRKDKIAGLIDDLGPGIEVLADHRGALTTMLRSLDELSDVAVDTVDRSKDDMLADLRALEPTLRRLAEAGDDFPRSMEMLLTFPFPDAVLDAIKGDYLNLYLKLGTKTTAKRGER